MDYIPELADVHAMGTSLVVVLLLAALVTGYSIRLRARGARAAR